MSGHIQDEISSFFVETYGYPIVSYSLLQHAKDRTTPTSIVVSKHQAPDTLLPVSPSQQERSKETASSQSSRHIQSHRRTTRIRSSRLFARLRRLSVPRRSRSLGAATATGRSSAAVAIVVADDSVGEDDVAAFALDRLGVLALVLGGALVHAVEEEAAVEGLAGAVGEVLTLLVAVAPGGGRELLGAALDAGGEAGALCGDGRHDGKGGDEGGSEVHVDGECD